MIVERHFTLSALNNHPKMQEIYNEIERQAICELIDSDFAKSTCIVLKRNKIISIQEIHLQGEDMWVVNLKFE